MNVGVDKENLIWQHNVKLLCCYVRYEVFAEKHFQRLFKRKDKAAKIGFVCSSLRQCITPQSIFRFNKLSFCFVAYYGPDQWMTLTLMYSTFTQTSLQFNIKTIYNRYLNNS